MTRGALKEEREREKQNDTCRNNYVALEKGPPKQAARRGSTESAQKVVEPTRREVSKGAIRRCFWMGYQNWKTTAEA